MISVPFNIPPCVGDEYEYVRQAILSHKISGDGSFTKKCHTWMEKRFQVQKVLLTTSGTTALDMALLLCNLQPGDEVILPSYTFSSTATAAVMVGARLVFVDVRPDTMNMDETKVEAAITDRTKVIIVMHYAGVACEMDYIMRLAKKYQLLVVEDAAQGVMSTYKGKALGTIGDFGCYSFHETKNFSMGEGGALLINNPIYNERAEILREKGTNRSQFYHGQVDKYTWVDKGDSFLPSELNAAYLWAQLLRADDITENRRRTWFAYRTAFQDFVKSERIDWQTIPESCKHNAHMFYLKLHDFNDRCSFINHMREHEVECVFHYIPLHSSPAGMRFGRFSGEDRFTTHESERLVRLPLYYGMEEPDQETVIQRAMTYLETSY